ncbi:MAG: M28 family metallopeptidase [Cytophagaceae bacterium]
MKKINMALKTALTFFLVLSSILCQAQDMNRVRKYLKVLCAPKMAGRGYVKEGDKKAAAFLKKEFEKIGLQAFKGTYFQHFNMDINTFPGKAVLKDDFHTLVTGKDYIVNPISGSGKGSYPVKYLDTLIFSDASLRSRFLSENNSGVVFVYEARHYQKMTELGIEYLNKIHEAACIIELEDRKLTASLSGNQFSHPFFKVKKEAFNTTTKKISFDLDAKLIKNYQSQNVIGYIRGKSKPDSMIIVSAHYDHLGKMGKKTYFPGANDNASGISMLLELARHYATPGNEPEYTIFFMAFGGEEAGLLGSKYFTEHPYFFLTRIRFMINLDLLGTGDDGMMVVNATLNPAEFSLLESINQQKKYLPVIKKRGAAANSDHYYFSERDVPAFFFYTLGGIAAYHDIYDKPQTLPLTRFKEVFLLITDFIREI